MARLTKTLQAEHDLEDVWLYIAADTLEAADRFLDLVHEKLLRLATQPMMGRTRPDLGEDLRSFPIGRYMAFYVPLKDGVHLVRFIQGSRDIGADDFLSEGNA